ncbi:MAG: hypothetical protein AB1305_01170 [Candidatus Hadarchaeota archaeon]
MRTENSGFFSIDAMFALTLMMLISTSFLNVYEVRKQAAELMGAKLEARMVGEKFAAVINSVYPNGDNFEIRMNLPENVGVYSYRIVFDNSTWKISVENSAWGTIEVVVATNAVRNFSLSRDNLRKTIRVYRSENQVRVENT